MSNGGPANLPEGPSASRAMSDSSYSTLMRSAEPLRKADREVLVSNEHHIRRLTRKPIDEPFHKVFERRTSWK